MYTHRYYLTGEKVNNHIWESNLSSKPKAKRLVNCFSIHINTETRLTVSHTGVSCNLLGVQISREDLSLSLWCFFSVDQTGERIVWKRTGMVFNVKENVCNEYYVPLVVYETNWCGVFFLQAQFGRRWTKIAKLVGSRSVLQIKSYARQYFKHKARLYLQHMH